MKSNRIIWGLVSLVVLITAVISSGAFERYGLKRNLEQPKVTPPTTPAPEIKDTRDLSMYASIDYSKTPENPSSARFSANKRYDNDGWVYKMVHPSTGGIGRITEDPPSPLYPVDESEFIVTGEVISINAFLSNDRGCVYTEFTIRIEEFLKNSNSSKEAPKTVMADREGGVVIYPNGQRVLYQSSDRGLPHLGSRYLFFLRKNGPSPNYEIISSYDITGDRVYPMESGGRNFEEFKKLNKTVFLETTRNRAGSLRNQ